MEATLKIHSPENRNKKFLLFSTNYANLAENKRAPT